MGSCFSDFDEVSLYHFDLHQVIGKGVFSKVRVVRHRPSRRFYALKYTDKARCIHEKAVVSVIRERQFLEEIAHTFIVKLRYAFQDDKNCFFVLDLMLGGDLRFHLGRNKQIPENHVRFWVAELSSALDYLHRQRIMHRDVKPDNVLLDGMGHAHITDFNTAMRYSDRRFHTSVAGTTAYMAPQVIKQSYSWHVDWWSLGVTAYELLFHKRPFDGKNTVETIEYILQGTLTFPEPTISHRRSSAAISALKGFIDPDPHTRLGCHTSSQGLEGIHRHPWFADIDWDALERKECQPPFVPDETKVNFDLETEVDG